MTDTAAFTIGSGVACRDGSCGQLRRVVVDPVAKVVTHLVVEPGPRAGRDRLVPADLVESSSGDTIRLRCSVLEFEALEDAEETRFLADPGGQWGYGRGQLLALPYFPLGMGAAGTGGAGMGAAGVAVGTGMGTNVGMAGGPQQVTYDRVPAGEVEVQRGERVHATDGAIGRVQGLVVDVRDHGVTHVLLDEGHLWGARRVAIPISAVVGVDDDGVALNLTKAEVRDLPEVDVGQPS